VSQPIKELLPEIMEGRCILFLGSGSSANCESAAGGGLTGQGLTQELIAHLGEDASNFQTNLQEVSEFIEVSRPRHRADLDDFIYQRLRDLRPTIGHLLLTMFPWRALVTTNFNQAIERGYDVALQKGLTRYSCLPILTDGDFADLQLKDGEMPLFKPHGCISVRGNPDTPMVLTKKDYFRSVQKRSAIYGHIRELAQSYVTLFLGYSLEDYSFNNLYYELQTMRDDYFPQSYTVQPLRQQKAEYMRRSYAKRHMTLIDDMAETFIMSLTDASGLLTDDVQATAIDELARPAVRDRLREYAASLPEPVRNRMPLDFKRIEAQRTKTERRKMARKWDPVAGVFVDETSPPPPADSFVPSLGTSPLFPNLDSPEDPDKADSESAPSVSSLPVPEVGS